jgi:hypothetical protein
VFDWVRSRYADERPLHLADELRSRGEYKQLAERARDKQRVLSERGLDEPTLKDAGIEAEALTRWYCEERLERPVPRDRAGFLLELWISDWEAFEREALRELLYTRLRERTERTG